MFTSVYPPAWHILRSSFHVFRSSRLKYTKHFCNSSEQAVNNNNLHLIINNTRTGLGSAVGRASAYGTGGPGFDSRGLIIPKTLKMVVMASLLAAQELRVSITTHSSVSL